MDANKALMAKMLAEDGPAMDFEVSRTIDTQAIEGLGVTFSEAAMASLSQQMIMWVGTRIMRYGEQTGAMPQTLRVTVTVETQA